MTDFSVRIDALDGLHSTLTADRVGPWEVMVGGGPEWFVLTATAGMQSVNALAHACAAGGAAGAPDGGAAGAAVGGANGAEDGAVEATVDLTVGGQAVDYPARYVLRRDEVDAAIRELARVPSAEDLPPARWER